MKIIYSEKVEKILEKYIENFNSYYENLYSDSWIWSEEIIIKSYKKEAFDRKDDIINTINKKLWDTIIVYSENKAILKWRRKFLIVEFFDYNWYRIIFDLEIK